MHGKIKRLVVVEHREVISWIIILGLLQYNVNIDIDVGFLVCCRRLLAFHCHTSGTRDVIRQVRAVSVLKQKVDDLVVISDVDWSLSEIVAHLGVCTVSQ